MSSTDVAPFVHPMLLSHIIRGLDAMPGLGGKFAVFGSVATGHLMSVLTHPARNDHLPPPADVDIVCAMQDLDAVAAAAMELVESAIRTLNVQFSAISLVRDIEPHPTRKGDAESEHTTSIVACAIKRHHRIILKHDYVAGDCLIDVVGADTDVSRHVVPTTVDVRFRGGVVGPVRAVLPLISKQQLTWFIVNSICNEHMPAEKRMRAFIVANALKHEYEVEGMLDTVVSAEIKGLGAALVAESTGETGRLVSCACHVYGQIQAEAARRASARARTAAERAGLAVSSTTTVSISASRHSTAGTPGGESTRGYGVTNVGVQCDREPVPGKIDEHGEHEELIRLRERHRSLQMEAELMRSNREAYGDSLRALRCEVKAANKRADDAAVAFEARQFEIRKMRQQLKSAHQQHTASRQKLEEEVATLRKDAANAWAMFRALESEESTRDAHKNDQIEGLTIAYADAMRGLFQMKSGIYGSCLNVETLSEMYHMMKQKSIFRASSPVFQRIEAPLDLEITIRRTLDEGSLGKLAAAISSKSKPPSNSAKRRQRARAARRGPRNATPAAHAVPAPSGPHSPTEAKPTETKPNKTKSADSAPDRPFTVVDCCLKTLELCKPSASLSAFRAHVLKRQAADYIGMPEFMRFAEEGSSAPEDDTLGRTQTGSMAFFIRAAACIVAQTFGSARVHEEASAAAAATSDAAVASIEDAAKTLHAHPIPSNADAQSVFNRRIQERYIGLAQKAAGVLQKIERDRGNDVDSSKLLRKCVLEQADNVPDMTVMSLGSLMDIAMPPTVQCVIKFAQLFRGLFAAERAFHHRTNTAVSSALCMSLEAIVGRRSEPPSLMLQAFMRTDCGALGLFPEFQDDALSVFGREVPIPAPAADHRQRRPMPSACSRDCADDADGTDDARENDAGKAATQPAKQRGRMHRNAAGQSGSGSGSGSGSACARDASHNGDGSGGGGGGVGGGSGDSEAKTGDVGRHSASTFEW